MWTYRSAALTGLAVLLLAGAACFDGSGDRGLLSEVPEGAQAVSLLGEPLYSTTPTISTIAKLRDAEKTYKAEPGNADHIIWYGRRTAYAGDFRGAIRIFREGIRAFSKDARFYRHRGHRYISIREFKRAARDLEKAAGLIKGQQDRIEPDGLPNARNTPVSTLHTNIWYHLGLAHYLKNDLEDALAAYRSGIAASTNDDMLVATSHWLVMTLRRLGREDELADALEPIREKMDVIENGVYHRLCLFYKGLLSPEELTGADDSAIMNDAAAYGLGSWHLSRGRREEARRIFEDILKGRVWASFGYIAAEADLAREFNARRK